MDSYLYQTIEFAHPNPDHINKIIEGLLEDVKYLKVSAIKEKNHSTSQNLVHPQQQQQQQQKQVISSGNEEVFLKDENYGSGDIQEEGILPTAPNYDNMLMKVIPGRIEDAIQLIKQFTSNSYQQLIVQKVLQMLILKNENQQIDQNFLALFEKSWSQIKFTEECESQDANRYTSIREKIQSYYPEKQIFDHISCENQIHYPDVQLKILKESHKLISNEFEQLQGNDVFITKPLVKINQIRKYLMKYEPIKVYQDFVRFHSQNDVEIYERYLQKIDLVEDYQNMLQNYEELVKTFKEVEKNAYLGTKYAVLQNN